MAVARLLAFRLDTKWQEFAAAIARLRRLWVDREGLIFHASRLKLSRVLDVAGFAGGRRTAPVPEGGEEDRRDTEPKPQLLCLSVVNTLPQQGSILPLGGCLSHLPALRLKRRDSIARAKSDQHVPDL